MSDVVLLGAVVVATAILAWWWRRRQGSVRAGRDGERLSAPDLAALGAPSDRVVLLEFTAPGCVACRATRSVLDDAAAERDDVQVVVAQVGHHLDLVRAHGILRAPTTLVIDRDGTVRHRITGVPDRARLAALLDPSRGDRAA